MKFYYKMRRPFSIGTFPQPKPGTMVTVEKMHPSAEPLKDVISYSYELPEEATKAYELTPIVEVGDGKWHSLS
jgi:hypothetical protein